MPKISAEFSHALGAVLDYGFDWRGKGWLESDENITTSNWTVIGPSGYALSNPYNVNGIVTVIVANLSLGGIYKITNTIVTSKGRTDSRTLIISCKRR